MKTAELNKIIDKAPVTQDVPITGSTQDGEPKLGKPRNNFHVTIRFGSEEEIMQLGVAAKSESEARENAKTAVLEMPPHMLPFTIDDRE